MSTTITGRAPVSAVLPLTEIVVLAGRRLRHLGRAPGRLVGVALNPLVILIAVGYLFKNAIDVPPGERYQDYLMAGTAMQVGLACIGPTAVSVALDLRTGLMDRFRSLPVSRPAVLVAHALGDWLIGLAVLVLVALAGLGIGWRPQGGPLSIAAGFGVAAAFILVAVWAGIVLGVLVRNAESIDSVGALVLVVCTFLSNAVLPTRSLPGWLQPVVEWNPVSAFADSCRHLWGTPARSAGGFPVDHPYLTATMWGAVLLSAAVWIGLRRFRATAE
ncbi:ABC transporter permease [Streptomyces sp. NPDC002793]|uniref:ABC transporter permease n=1 Tax=Streptomyces sp. NPDC002793 TaxID=3154432 RepID=UPI00332A8492